MRPKPKPRLSAVKEGAGASLGHAPAGAAVASAHRSKETLFGQKSVQKSCQSVVMNMTRQVSDSNQPRPQGTPLRAGRHPLAGGESRRLPCHTSSGTSSRCICPHSHKSENVFEAGTTAGVSRTHRHTGLPTMRPKLGVAYSAEIQHSRKRSCPARFSGSPGSLPCDSVARRFQLR